MSPAHPDLDIPIDAQGRTGSKQDWSEQKVSPFSLSLRGLSSVALAF
jgi:hypothetical protein